MSAGHCQIPEYFLWNKVNINWKTSVDYSQIEIFNDFDVQFSKSTFYRCFYRMNQHCLLNSRTSANPNIRSSTSRTEKYFSLLIYMKWVARFRINKNIDAGWNSCGSKQADETEKKEKILFTCVFSVLNLLFFWWKFIRKLIRVVYLCLFLSFSSLNAQSYDSWELSICQKSVVWLFEVSCFENSARVQISIQSSGGMSDIENVVELAIWRVSTEHQIVIRPEKLAIKTKYELQINWKWIAIHLLRINHTKSSRWKCWILKKILQLITILVQEPQFDSFKEATIPFEKKKTVIIFFWNKSGFIS